MTKGIAKRPRIHFIAEWIDRLGLQQSDVVDAIDVNKGTVSKWCSGALPSEVNLMALARFLEVEPLALFHNPQGEQPPSMGFNEKWLPSLLEAVEGSYHMLGLDQEEANELLKLVLEVSQEPPTPSGGGGFHRILSEIAVRKFLKSKRIRDENA